MCVPDRCGFGAVCFVGFFGENLLDVFGAGLSADFVRCGLVGLGVGGLLVSTALQMWVACVSGLKCRYCDMKMLGLGE